MKLNTLEDISNLIADDTETDKIEFKESPDSWNEVWKHCAPF